jgi:uroporphyrin-III C-methyltransferase/precorrin-2 dehydrogenase/sirohydrochlorin ferrochelatase
MDYLPVFLNLRDQQVLVVGGGAVATRKVELLLNAHARVRVVAPRLHPELALYRDAGRIEYLACDFQPQHFDGAIFAVAATDCAEVNHAVAAVGAARAIFVNVVDDAAASSAVMPAIVDRSPLVVAIGSSGQSPTLARRVRAQLEALLPERLGDLARLAGEARERVQRALPDDASGTGCLPAVSPARYSPAVPGKRQRCWIPNCAPPPRAAGLRVARFI